MVLIVLIFASVRSEGLRPCFDRLVGYFDKLVYLMVIVFELDEVEVVRVLDIIGEEFIDVCSVRIVGVIDIDEVNILNR